MKKMNKMKVRSKVKQIMRQLCSHVFCIFRCFFLKVKDYKFESLKFEKCKCSIWSHLDLLSQKYMTYNKKSKFTLWKQIRADRRAQTGQRELSSHLLQLKIKNNFPKITFAKMSEWHNGQPNRLTDIRRGKP